MKFFSTAAIAATLFGAVRGLPTNTDLVARGPSDLEARSPSDLEARKVKLAPRPIGPEVFKITDFYLARKRMLGPIDAVVFRITAQWEGSTLSVKCSAYDEAFTDGVVPIIHNDRKYSCGPDSPFEYKYIPKFSKGHRTLSKSRLFLYDKAAQGGTKRGYVEIPFVYCRSAGGKRRGCTFTPVNPEYTITLKHQTLPN